MKKLLILSALLFTSSAYAQEDSYDVLYSVQIRNEIVSEGESGIKTEFITKALGSKYVSVSSIETGFAVKGYNKEDISFVARGDYSAKPGREYVYSYRNWQIYSSVDLNDMLTGSVDEATVRVMVTVGNITEGVRFNLVLTNPLLVWYNNAPKTFRAIEDERIRAEQEQQAQAERIRAEQERQRLAEAERQRLAEEKIQRRNEEIALAEQERQQRKAKRYRYGSTVFWGSIEAFQSMTVTETPVIEEFDITGLRAKIGFYPTARFAFGFGGCVKMNLNSSFDELKLVPLLSSHLKYHPFRFIPKLYAYGDIDLNPKQEEFYWNAGLGCKIRVSKSRHRFINLAAGYSFSKNERTYEYEGFVLSDGFRNNHRIFMQLGFEL